MIERLGMLDMIVVLTLQEVWWIWKTQEIVLLLVIQSYFLCRE